MKSSSGHEWDMHYFPRGLRRTSAYSISLCLIVALSAVGVAVGAYLTAMQSMPPNPPSLGPYLVILISTGCGVAFASMVWSAARELTTVTNWERIPENVEQLSPPHRQRWSYRDNNMFPWGALCVSAIWHLVGLLAGFHFIYMAWPQVGVGVLVFLVYEAVGLIPATVTVRGCRSAFK